MDNFEKNLKVQVGKVKDLKLFEVTKSEIEILKRGDDGPIYLNFAIALLSMGFPFLYNLLTTASDSVHTLSFLYSAVGICFIFGTLLLIISIRKNRSRKVIWEQIEKRLPESDSILKPLDRGPNSQPL